MENIKIRFIKFIKKIKKMEYDKIDAYSAECAYYTILSFIPFLILLMTTIKYTKIEPQILIEYISKIVPISMKNVVIDIIQEIYSKSVGTMSLSIIFVLLSAGRGVYAFKYRNYFNI